ncbi:MAG: S-layer homology domain-containing protein [Bacteroidota bacterium]|nr:S-layer homology domain-containing protein [Bacteroidota bacterium]
MKPGKPFVYFFYNKATFTESLKYTTEQQKAELWESFFSTYGVPQADVNCRVVAPYYKDSDGSAISGASGFANSADERRGVSVFDKRVNKEISRACYNYNDNLTGNVLENTDSCSNEYLFFPGFDPANNIESVLLDFNANPSPGQLIPEQTVKGDDTKPNIIYTKDSDYREKDQSEFRIQVKDADTQYVIAYYKTNYQKFYRPVYLKREGSTDYFTGEMPVAELESAQSISYYFVASDGTNYEISPVGCGYDPYIQKIGDVSGPRIISQYPENGAQIEGSFNGQIVIEYKDSSGIDKSKINLNFEGRDVTSQAIITDTKIYYTPGELKEQKRYNYTLTLADTLGGEIPAGSGNYPYQNVTKHDLCFDIVPINASLSIDGQIIHSPMKKAIDSQDLEVTAVATDKNSPSTLSLVYGFNNNPPSKTLEMSKKSSTQTGSVYTNIYTAKIPKGELKNNKSVSYYIMSGDTRAPSDKSKLYTTNISVASPTPELIMTEVLANPASLDDCEFVELLNTGDYPLNLHDYRVDYDTQPLVSLESDRSNRIPTDCILYPGEVAILWFVTAYSEENEMTIQSFKDKMNIGKSTVPVVEFPANSSKNPGYHSLHNTGEKILRLAKYNAPKNEYICQLTYNDETDKGYNNATAAMSVTYGPPSDGTNNLTKLDQVVTPSPGTIDYRQKKINYNDVSSPLIIYQNKDIDKIDTGDYRIKVKIIDECDLRYSAVWFKTYTSSSHTYATKDGWVEANLTPVYGEPNYYEFTVPDYFIKYTDSLEFYFEASDGLHFVTLNDVNGTPFKVNFKDTIGPRILTYKPEPYYYYEFSKYPTFSMSFEDSSGIDKSSIRLYIAPEDKVTKNGVVDSSLLRQKEFDVTPSANIRTQDRGYLLSYGSPTPYADGTYVAELYVLDNEGNRNVPFVPKETKQYTYFYVGDSSKMNHYKGELHSHTVDSDGQGTPEEAYTYARDKGGVDYFSVTDHNTSMSELKFLSQVERMKEFYNPGPNGFINFHGWEMSWGSAEGWQGHFNALNVTKWVESTTQINLSDFYEKLISDPDAVGQFNHPNIRWGVFDDFGRYNPAYDGKIVFFEYVPNSTEQDYYRALTKGWHVSPSSNEDNHQKKWTTSDPRIGVTIAPSLTHDNLVEAWRRNRCYISGDGNTAINYKINGEWMGSRLKDPTSLNFDIEVFCKDGKSVNGGDLVIVSEDSTIVYKKTYTAGDLTDGKAIAHFTLPPQYKYYIAKFVRTGINQTVSAPIWVERTGGLTITGFESGQSSDISKPHTVFTTVKNIDTQTLTDVRMDFYRGNDKPEVPDAELVLSSDLAAYTAEMAKPEAERDPAVIASANIPVPIESRTFDSIKPNESITTGVNLSTDTVNQRIYVRVSGKKNGVEYVDFGYTVVTPVLVSEICALNNNIINGAGETVENEFKFLELYNDTNTDINLNGSSINLFESSGKNPTNTDKAYGAKQCLDITRDFVIKPSSTKVVWYRFDRSYTINDFDKYYGVNLTENDIYVADGFSLSATGGKKVELKINGVRTLVTEYNMDLLASCCVTNKSIDFKYPTTGWAYGTILNTHAAPTPGSVSEKQVPVIEKDYSIKSLSLVNQAGESINVGLSEKATSYRVSVPDGTKSVRVFPVLNNPSLKIRVNGEEQYSGEGLTTLNLDKNTGATALVEVIDGANKVKASYTFSAGSGELNIGDSGGGNSGGSDNPGGTPGGDDNTNPPDNGNTSVTFTDTTNHWANEAVSYIANKGIIKGYDDGTFKPDATVNRGDFTLMLMRAFAGGKIGTGTFSDVDSNAYYANAVATAKDLGIATGWSGAFNPTANVTRQDMFVLFARTLRAFNLLDEKADLSKVTFSDSGSIADYAQNDILLLAANGYINGTDGKINPAGTATRAETAQMLYNYFTKTTSNN